MNPTYLLLLAILSPVLCGLLTLIVPRRIVGLRVLLTLAGPVAALACLGHVAYHHGLGAPLPVVEWMPAFQLNLALQADALGMFFALLVSGVGLLIVLYARGYFGPDEDSLFRFYPTLLLFMTAMLGVVLSDNLMLMLLFWEMTSISSFLLIGWERDDPAAVKKAMQAFITTGAGGLAMMGGLILLGVITGQWTYTGLLAHVGEIEQIGGSGLMTTAFVLIFIGAGAKSAQFPLHYWLPGAMAAPTPVSAYLHSATMVKAGVYLVGRLWPIMAAAVPLWPRLIVPLGAVTMVYGAFIALQKKDLKQIFAYTTVSQLGLLMCMYGLSAFKYVSDHATHATGALLAAADGGPGEHGSHVGDAAHSAAGEPNLIWDVAQILNHALYKAPLFILAGAIGHIASRELDKLQGFFHRGRTERIMTVVLLLAAYALAAGPLTVSFTAKEFFFYQIWHAYESTHNPWFYLLIAAGVATGMFNVAIFIRLAVTLLKKAPAPADPLNPHGQSLDDQDHGHHVDPHHEEEDAHGHGGGHGHGDHAHETGIWPAFLWIPGLVIVAFQFIGGAVPGAYEALFGWLEASPYYFDHFPLVWDAHLGVPLYMSLAAVGLGIALGFAPLLRGVYNDPFDKTYSGFYLLTTKGGGRVFGLLQNGHNGRYLALVWLSVVGMFVWSIWDRPAVLAWPAGAVWDDVQNPGELWLGVALTGVVCLAAVLMPLVRNRASRVLVLGAVGFSVTGVYYLYKAPDLALTQISIEIVSLVLFLLVLSLLPDAGPPKQRLVVGRLLLSGAVGVVAFWITLSSTAADRPTMPYLNAQGEPFAHLGEFFLRNSYHAEDLVGETHLRGGVVPREAPAAHGEAAHGEVAQAEPAMVVHPGGGGANVVNVILVDFRGFDTMGEVAVLGLAALGVWTLLRRPKRKQPAGKVGAAGPADEAGEKPAQDAADTASAGAMV